MNNVWLGIFAGSVALTFWVWPQVLSESSELTVSFLAVGQGDSIYIRAPGGIDLLIDGGPDRSVLRQLPKQLGLFDRRIDMVIATHPDKDHIAGLPEVFKRYAVSYFLEPGVEHESSFVAALTNAIASEKGIVHLRARRGMRVHLGNNVYADVLFPDRDVSHLETNDASIVLRLVYGGTSFLLAGDASTKIEDYLVLLDGERLQSDVLKASHHGSKHSTSEVWLSAVRPKVVVISVGKGNTYGHPAPEVLKRIRNAGAAVVSTMERGTVTVVSDGVEVWFET